MIDPCTASEIAIAGITVCLHAGKLLKKTFENIKNVKQDLLKLVTETERYRNVLGLLKIMTRELLQTKFKDLELAIDPNKMQETLDAVRRVSSSIAGAEQKSGQLFAGLNWTLKKSEAERLVDRLRKEQTALMEVVVFINATATLRSLQELDAIKAGALNKVTVTDAFDSPAPKDPEAAVRPSTWLGHVNTEALPPAYVAARHVLSKAAYDGNWDQVFQMLEHGHQQYQENWVNVCRLRPLIEYQRLSFWCPLHQAAFWNAPLEVVQRLLDWGASRTLRTRYSELSYSDQTASEIASDQGHYDIARITAPVIRSPVPHQVLDELEKKFHSLIECDIGARVDHEHLYLPKLILLTELGAEAMWFEVKSHVFQNAGYLFRLDGRDLLVRSHNIKVDGEAKDYRIDSQKVEEVQDATMINEVA